MDSGRVNGAAATKAEAPDRERWRHSLAAAWPDFLARREDRLRRGGEVAAHITRDLLKLVLLWPGEEIAAAPGPGLMLGQAPAGCYVALGRPGAIEARRPGACALARRAAGYARAQAAAHSGACDGGIFFLQDHAGGTRRERVHAWLGQTMPPGELWWVTPAGLGQTWTQPQGEFLWAPRREALGLESGAPMPVLLLDPKYGLPASCFAYAADGRDPRTWKLPFRGAAGRPDLRRLILAATRVTTDKPRRLGVPEVELGLVIRRLAEAARALGELPPQCARPHPAMARLAVAEQRLGPRGAMAGSPHGPAEAQEPSRSQPEASARRFGPAAADGRVGQARRWM